LLKRRIWTFVLGAKRAMRTTAAKRAMRAVAALPALFSSRKLIVEFINNTQMIPIKSWQSGGSPWN
jgi:hypothetical protein